MPTEHEVDEGVFEEITLQALNTANNEFAKLQSYWDSVKIVGVTCTKYDKHGEIKPGRAPFSKLNKLSPCVTAISGVCSAGVTVHTTW